MKLFSCFCLKDSSSPPAQNGEVPAQAHPTTGSRQNLDHFQEDRSICMLSSLVNLANFAVCSDVLFQSWEAIRETKDQFDDQLSGDLNVQFKEKVLPKYNIVVCVTSPITRSRLLEKTEMVSSKTIENTELVSPETISGFGFLRSKKKNSSFSINKAALSALSLFHSSEAELSMKVDQIARKAESKPYIITGDGIGGCVASLFALRLLFQLNAQKAKMPLCVTFGSPLLGDFGLQRAISEHTTWNSCFLHVVSMDDCFPSLFVQPNHAAVGQMTDQTSTYHPFGRFMFYSNSVGASFESPESALSLLEKASFRSGLNEESFDYASVIANLRKGLICNTKVSGPSRGSTTAAAQYLADLFQLQLQDVGRNLKLEMSVQEQRRQTRERAAKDLNDIKMNMTQIEWYKKTSERNKIPYYDGFKNQSFPRDIKVNEFIGMLQKYWEGEVKEAAEKPQKAGAALRDRWLLGGITYRRLVEPLAIADYYRRHKGSGNYIKERPKHYEILETWGKEYQATKGTKKQNTSPPSLTEDSCFWAHVEEAITSCKSLINGGESASNEIENLKKFEKYVFELMKKYQVSSDIFLKESSFMKWWREYEKILDKEMKGTRTSYTSPLAEIMHLGNYNAYTIGRLSL